MLGLPRTRRRTQSVGGVGVPGQLAPGGDRAGAVLPVQPSDRVLRDRTERLDGPLRNVGGGLLAELATAPVGRLRPGR